MSIKQIQHSMSELPTQVQQMMLAFSILMNRLGTLPKSDRDDLFELLQEWRTEKDAAERENIQSAMMEIIAGEPLTVTPLDLTADVPPGEFARWFGKRVRELREKAGWSQQQLADKVGIPQSYVSRVETGEHAPTRKTVEKFAKALKVTVRDLDPTEE